MIKDSQAPPLSELDRAILTELQTDGRISNVELARRVHLSPPATHARHKRLEREGFIRQARTVLIAEPAADQTPAAAEAVLPPHPDIAITYISFPYLDAWSPLFICS